MYCALTGSWFISVKFVEDITTQRHLVVTNSGTGFDGIHVITKGLTIPVNPSAGAPCYLNVMDNMNSKTFLDSKTVIRFPYPSACCAKHFEIGTRDANENPSLLPSDFDDVILYGIGAGDGFITYSGDFHVNTPIREVNW